MPPRRTLPSHTYRRNTFLALMLCLVIVGLVSMPSHQQAVSTEREIRRHRTLDSDDSPEDVFQRMQHNTLTIEECTGSKCTKEVVRVHDAAVLDDSRTAMQQEQQQHASNASHTKPNSISIQKEIGKPLVVTVKQNGSDPGQQVQSGDTILATGTQEILALSDRADIQQKLNNVNPEMAQRVAEIAEELGNHNAAQHLEGDNVLDVHRSDLNTSLEVTPIDESTQSVESPIQPLGKSDPQMAMAVEH